MNYKISIPKSIAILADRLLNIKDNNTIADVCVCDSTYLDLSLVNHPNNKHTAVGEIVGNLSITQQINCIQDSIFNLNPKDNTFDKIFCFTSLSVPLNSTPYRGSIMERIIEKKLSIPVYIPKATWCEVLSVVECLSPSGRAVCVMNTSELSGTGAKEFREYLIDNGLVEAVVELPVNLLAETSIGLVMIVLSFGNTSVKMVEAVNDCVLERRTSTITNENIETIYNKYVDEHACIVDNEVIKANNYLLKPLPYLFKPDAQNQVAFGEIIKNIKRGVSISAKELDQLDTKDETGIKYIKLSNIQNGIIDNELMNLKEVSPKLDRFCLKDNTLILSKMGLPVKTAVVKVKPNEKLFANINMYSIELDTQKVLPYYVQAYLESEAGQAQLKAIASGTTIASISLEQLKTLKIPVPPMDVQKTIADEFLGMVQIIRGCYEIIDTNLLKIKNLFKLEIDPRTRFLAKLEELKMRVSDIGRQGE